MGLALKIAARGMIACGQGNFLRSDALLAERGSLSLALLGSRPIGPSLSTNQTD